LGSNVCKWYNFFLKGMINNLQKAFQVLQTFCDASRRKLN
jgi:hypothetical protein